MTAEACDIRLPKSVASNWELAQWIKANLVFDQLILEFYDPNVANSGWAHVSHTRNRFNRTRTLTAFSIPTKLGRRKTIYVDGLLVALPNKH